MAIESLLIINKSGGLLYQRNFIDKPPQSQAPNQPEPQQQLNSNDYLILASTLHGVFAIASQLTPKALQLSQNDIDYTIPYIPNVGMPTNGGRTGNGSTVGGGSGSSGPGSNKLGSFKGDDFFKDSFVSWNKSGLRQLCTCLLYTSRCV